MNLFYDRERTKNFYQRLGNSWQYKQWNGRECLTHYNDRMRILQIERLGCDHFGAGEAGVCIYRLKISNKHNFTWNVHRCQKLTFVELTYFYFAASNMGLNEGCLPASFYLLDFLPDFVGTYFAYLIDGFPLSIICLSLN